MRGRHRWLFLKIALSLRRPITLQPTTNLRAAIDAAGKLAEKRLDWIGANDVSLPGIGMNADDNTVLLIGHVGARHAFGPASKSAVAEFILSQVAP